ncbi:MAG TPA: hypothetical protein VFZ48_03050, partial [Candidatus Saccharimonadales bacterium]
GGALTVLTVDALSTKIKIMPFFIIGMIIMTCACIFSFICRKAISEYLVELVIFINKQRVDLNTAALQFMKNGHDEKVSEALTVALRNTQSAEDIPTLSKVYEFSDRYIGIGILLGVSITLCGFLPFVIQITWLS